MRSAESATWIFNVSRILLLITLVLWFCRPADGLLNPAISHGSTSVPGGTATVGLLAGGYALVVLLAGLWSRLLLGRLRSDNLHSSLRKFHRAMLAARIMIPVWFAVAIYLLGWGELVERVLGPVLHWPVELPGMILGTLPALIAWMALWWAQFPAERALREQALLVQFDQNLPVHAPPSFKSYFAANLRLQVLFILVPVGLIILMQDLGMLAWWKFTKANLSRSAAGAELAIQLASVAVVVLFVPEVLRHVLATHPLPNSPLRDRLEELCRRCNLHYRQILLWKTHHNMGNAAVMGIISPMRYVLLSDMLLETLTDRQIEAVFAHEIGHVRHRHMIWYVLLCVAFLLMLLGPGKLAGQWIDRWQRPQWLSDQIIGGAAAGLFLGLFFLVFGYISRWFERQADVFAARTLENSPMVGRFGAETFVSALRRVAVVNNIPLQASNFTHGSIAQRMQFVQSLADEPAACARFDRAVRRIHAGILLTLLIFGAWTAYTWMW